MPSDDIDWLGLSRAQHVALWGEQKRRRKGSGGNPKLRAARHRAHQAFDPIWRERHMSRTDAYVWLAVQMKWPKGDCHMGMMNADECERVVILSRAYLKNKARKT